MFLGWELGEAGGGEWGAQNPTTLIQVEAGGEHKVLGVLLST